MDILIPKKNRVIDSMLKLYESIDKNNEYEFILKDIDEELKVVENKKNMALDLVYTGILLLLVLSYIIYKPINLLEAKIKKGC